MWFAVREMTHSASWIPCWKVRVLTEERDGAFRGKAESEKRVEDLRCALMSLFAELKKREHEALDALIAEREMLSEKSRLEQRVKTALTENSQLSGGKNQLEQKVCTLEQDRIRLSEGVCLLE